jgi:hypothetical protein
MTEGYELPEGFEGLEAMAEKWARPTEDERNAIRFNAGTEDFAEFYEVMMPRLPGLLGQLAGYDPSPSDPAENRALQLVCAFAEAAPHHELYGGSPQVPFSFDARRFAPEHGRERI